MHDQENTSNHLPSSNPFLQRSEQQRLTRECFCLLDLRKLSPDLCRRYSYRGRSMWLDGNARRMFLDELKKHNGTFTVGSYETILDAYPAPVARGPVRQKPQASIFDNTGKGARQLRLHGGHNSVFELGYFEKRVDKRVKHTLPVLLLAGGKVIPAETRDISFRGLQVRARTTIQFRSGESVKIKIAPAAAAGEKLAEAVYRVVRAKTLLSEVIISLLSDEPRSNDTLRHLRGIVSSQSGTSLAASNLDLEDLLLTSHSTLAERCYMRSSAIIPLFVFKIPAEEAPLKIVFSNRNNSIALHAFETAQGHYDLSPLSRHAFIRTLVKLANREGQADALLAVRHAGAGDALLAVTQSDFKDSSDWYRFLARHIDAPNFSVFKILARFVENPASHRVLSDLDQLATRSTDLAEKLIQEAQNLYIAGSLIDVTTQIREWDLHRLATEEAPTADWEPIPEQADEHLPAPEIWPVRYIEEKRSENRFTGQMRVTFQLDGTRYGARTRDISTRGLSAYSDDPDIPLEKGSKVRVSFPGLKTGSAAMELLRGGSNDIPYEVVGVERGAPTLVRMKQLSDKQGTRPARTLADFIDQRRSKLPVELSHVYRSAASRLYSSHFIQSSGTIPFFVARKANEKRFNAKIGVVQSPSYLAGFFEVAEGEMDFASLIDAAALEQLLETMEQDGSAETALFLFKPRIPGTQRFRIVALDAQLGRNRRLEHNFVNSMGNPDFRFVKLTLSRPQLPPRVEMDQAVNRLQSAPKTKAEQLISEFSDLVAVGDIIDITGQYGPLQPFSLNE